MRSDRQIHPCRYLTRCDPFDQLRLDLYLTGIQSHKNCKSAERSGILTLGANVGDCGVNLDIELD